MDNSSVSVKNKAPLGDRIGFFEDLEIEEMVTNAPVAITKTGAGILSNITELFKGDIVGMSESKPDQGKLAIGGKTELNFREEQVKKEGAAFKKDFYQRLEADRKDLEHRSLEQIMEDLVRFEVGAMPTDKKNEALHLSLDYDEKHIRHPYHVKLLRDKKLEQIKDAQKNKQQAEIVAQSRPNNLLNQNAQEGQSIISQSGAILSAG